MSDGMVVGIDLGTTNSEVAALVDGRVRVLGPGNPPILPSCVGLSAQGELLVGAAAKNQLLFAPERTVRSVKRRMGSTEKIPLGDRGLSPEEISGLILRELAKWAEGSLGQPVRRAVITVPAYFSDAQRNATREAGALAGLEVARILNEPTAASLAYGAGGERRTLLVYDLGGGTFDVSIVTCEGEVTEVLASHGNNQLGGDDFDELLLNRLLAAFEKRHQVDLREGHALALSRLRVAAEAAKRQLSAEPYATVREEGLVTAGGVPLNLEVELSRVEYEELIRPLIEGTLESVSRALEDARKRPAELDGILLVGGSTRTPLVSRLLEERTGLLPRHEVQPDLCVALGAGVLASRLAGHEVQRVLVDVTPYSFGPSYLGERGGVPYPHCYRPIISRNTALPVTRTERYFTAYASQTAVELEIFQGDDPDALRNTLVGHFRVEGLAPVREPNEVLVQMSLDLDGILHVTATEKRTGLSKSIRIDGALRPRSAAELAAAREALEALWATRAEAFDDEEDEDGEESEGEPGVIASVEVGVPRPAAEGADPALAAAIEEARALLERCRAALPAMQDDDREEAVGLNEQLEGALHAGDDAGLAAASASLKELLYFVESRP